MGVACLSIYLEGIECFSTALLCPRMKSQYCFLGGLDVLEDERLQRSKRNDEPLWQVTMGICVGRFLKARLERWQKHFHSLRSLLVGPESFGGDNTEDGSDCL